MRSPLSSVPIRSRMCCMYESVATSTCSTSPWSTPGAAARSSSICSSEASDSLCPWASKNFTPLYSGGLCEAEITTPRSSASSATAGVGRTPPRMQSPPADTTPRANAVSSSTLEARVSRPTKTLAAPVQSDAARPRRSTSSGVSSSPTTPRTPSVPKYLRARAGKRLPLAELRRLARLVQAGLLALDDAGVAREEACALQRHAKLRVDLHERTSDPVAHGTRLTRRAAAVHAHAQVVLALEPGRLERSRREHAVHLAREVLLDLLPVDPRVSIAGTEDDARDRGLALAGAEILSGSRHLHLESGRCLRLVRMLRAGVDLQLGQLCTAELVAREHPLDGLPKHFRRLPVELLAERALAQPAGVAGVLVVHLLLELLPR